MNCFFLFVFLCNENELHSLYIYLHRLSRPVSSMSVILETTVKMSPVLNQPVRELKRHDCDRLLAGTVQMEVVLNVPIDVLRHQFSPFLTLKELVNLDTALCHKKSRTELKKRLEGFTLSGSPSTTLNLKHLNWLRYWKISLQHFSLDEKLPDRMPTAWKWIRTLFLRESMLANCAVVFAKTTHCSLCLCEWAKDGDIVEILSQNFAHLQALDLTACYRLTDASLLAISQQCCHLQSLNLTEVYWVSDVGIQALCNGCRLLTVLVLTHCIKVTENGILSLVSNCSLLHTLNLTSCFGIKTLDEVIPLLQSMRHLL